MTPEPIVRLVSRDELEPLIAAFVDECELAELSPATIDNYRRTLSRYHWWCVQDAAPLDPSAHSPATVRSFLRYVQSTDERWDQPNHTPSTKPVGARTLHVYHRVLSRFYGWLVEQEYIDVSPLAKVRAPKYQSEQPDPFSDDELTRLAATLHDGGDGMLTERNRAIVAVLLDIGLRASELCAVKMPNYDLTSGSLLVVAGKGNKNRQLRLGTRGRKQVRRYWVRYRRNQGETGPLFMSVSGSSLTRSGLRQMTTDLGDLAGVEPCNPHRFRHTAAVNAIRAGMREFELQLMLGHTSLEMTRRYVKLVHADIIRASQEHSALDHLKLSL